MTGHADDGHWLLLSGGVGGAKLALGLDRVLPAGALTIVANTGDDFTHLGFAISPDVDTLLYTLGGQVNADTGWGRAGESWHFMDAVTALGGEDWFRLGDRDLAMHVERTRRLAAGETLTAVTTDVARRWRLASRILPMSDEPAPLRVRTDEGLVAFQDYFVRRRAAPVVRGFECTPAAPNPAVLATLSRTDLRGVVVAPSNPWLSIAPLLALPGLREAIAAAHVPVVAVSPIVAGDALKGPTAKIMRELGIEPSCHAIARHYRGLVHGLVVDDADAHEAPRIEAEGIRTRVTATVMRTLEDRLSLARATLAFAGELRLAGVP